MSLVRRLHSGWIPSLSTPITRFKPGDLRVPHRRRFRICLADRPPQAISSSRAWHASQVSRWCSNAAFPPSEPSSRRFETGGSGTSRPGSGSSPEQLASKSAWHSTRKSRWCSMASRRMAETFHHTLQDRGSGHGIGRGVPSSS